MHWLWAQTSAQAGSVDALFRVDLSDSTLQARKYLRDKIIPPPPLAQMHTPVHFIPMLPEVAAPPPPIKQSIRAEYRWRYMLNSLLRLCNVTAAADPPPPSVA